MAIPFALPSDEDAEDQSQQQLEQLMLDLYAALQQVLRARNSQHPSRNHRLPRRSADMSGTRDHPMLLVDSDLSRLPLPDLVLSAVEQLPAPPPQVTVSAPSSPTRDAAFQFPECSGASAAMMMPVPSPRPKPRRRRLTSEGSLPEKAQLPQRLDSCTGGRGTCCAHHLAASLDEREWATVGANLRNIADDFHASKTKDAEVEKSRLPFIGSSFSSSTSGLGSSGLGSSPSGSTDSILSLLMPAPLRETLWTTLALYLGWRLVSRLR
ncbi:uncharacterized protein LOC100680206 [Nasonia vitripennis]|uniref:Uncharacterized protein n=1 Tax=Nasonia vitripennis TaxID=7425 RepID=A0A7M7GCE2_NASVI|nr:uncharacterized protein LOC100680206 [Nasonia vitripennis]